MIEDSKYIVLKKDQFVEWWNKLDHRSDKQDTSLEFITVKDAVVIRRQDVFAPPALDAYANAITVALELVKEPSTNAQRLQNIADYFHEQAHLAWHTERKIPD